MSNSTCWRDKVEGDPCHGLCLPLYIQNEARTSCVLGSWWRSTGGALVAMPLCPRSYFVAWAASRAIVIPDTLVDRVRMYAVCSVRAVMAVHCIVCDLHSCSIGAWPCWLHNKAMIFTSNALTWTQLLCAARGRGVHEAHVAGRSGRSVRTWLARGLGPAGASSGGKLQP
jgi:hypothetical protein